MLTKVPSSMQQRGLPPQFFTGFEVIRDPTVPTKRVVVSPGSCRSQLDDADIFLATAMMKRLDQTWAAGSGNGALDAGSLAASTWYHLHAMLNLITGAVDILASGSLTNPAFPAGWAAAPSRRVWSVLTDSSANIIPFTQTEDWCAWGVIDSQFNSGNFGASATVVQMKCPTGFKCRVQALILSAGSFDGGLGMMDPDAGDPSQGRFWQLGTKTANQGISTTFERFTDINGRLVGWAESNATVSVQTIGYWDRRGRA